MNAVRGTMLVCAISISGLACSAQDIAIPFEQIERNAQVSAKMEMPGGVTPASYSSSASPAEPFSSGAGMVRVAPATIHRNLGAKFYLLNGLELGMAIADVEATHRCIVSHQCRETNPLMPSNLAGALTVNFAFASFSTFTSYRMKKHNARMWWLSPTAGIAAHVAGLATGLAHQ